MNTPINRAFRCWLLDQPDLGEAIVFAANSDRARYTCALTAAKSGFIPRANPSLVGCRRSPEHDRHPLAKPGHCFAIDQLASTLTAP